ncbi:hypothetical protein PCK1_000920 [Pneumocystis canis]|nr:hypothetical protein PCK1_000920 [Pneumocystis canis]
MTMRTLYFQAIIIDDVATELGRPSGRGEYGREGDTSIEDNIGGIMGDKSEYDEMVNIRFLGSRANKGLTGRFGRPDIGSNPVKRAVGMGV